MVVKKVDGQWAVVHGHPKKEGSKTDKPEGAIIHKFDTKKEAEAMHAAIYLSQHRRGK